MTMRTLLLFLGIIVASLAWSRDSQELGTAHGDPAAAHDHAHHHDAIDSREEYIDQVMHHIRNSNEIHLWGDVSIPLPIMVYDFQKGFFVTLSSAFHHGHQAVNGYVLNHGRINKVVGDFPSGSQHVGSIEGHDEHSVLNYEGSTFHLEEPFSLMKKSSFIDFSITKNVANLLLAFVLLWWVFGAVRKGLERREGQAPKGIQSFMEPLILFVRDEIAKPFIGPNYERYLPFVMSLFFFILVLNLLGLVPFIGGANVTGNASTTLALSLITFILVLAVSKKDYWAHMLWMPGVPLFVKPVLALIELISLLIRPLTLFIRLGANITAGHIAILAMVGLIFIFGDFGRSMTGSGMGLLVAVPFTLFMNFMELFVAFLQAFIFTLLSSLYIGQAIETHDEHH